MDYTIFESRIISPFLGAHNSKGRARFWIMLLLGIAFVLAITGGIVPDLIPSFEQDAPDLPIAALLQKG